MSLLERVDLPPIKPTALMIEVPVRPEVVPLLVTGVDNMVWVQQVPKGLARTFIRPTTLSESEIISDIIQMSEKSQWGNVFPCTKQGMISGVTYLAEYGFSVEELETYGKPCGSKIPHTDADIPYTLLIPRDRAYLGWVCTWGDGRSTAVIHNAARGMVVLK